MDQLMIYLMLIPAMVIGVLMIVYPFVLRAKKKKIEKNNKIVQEILDQYAKEVEIRTRFDIAYEDRRNSRKVINVDFVDCTPKDNDAIGWKLVYNEELGIYQKVPR